MSRNDSETPEIPEIEVEFPRPIDVSRILSKGRQCKFEASEQERAALAERYAVLSIDSLVAECFIAPSENRGKKKHYKLEATFRAKVVQSCGISLDPIEENISGEFTIILQQASKKHRGEPAEIDFTHDEEDIEFLSSDIIDVGEMIAQHFSLAINPYPRKQGVTGEELGQKIIKEEDSLLETEKKNPFDVLKSLKHKT